MLRPIALREPLCIADLATAFETTKPHIHRVIVHEFECLIPDPGYIFDKRMIKDIGKSFGFLVELGPGNAEDMEEAEKKQQQADQRFIDGFRRD